MNLRKRQLTFTTLLFFVALCLVFHACVEDFEQSDLSKDEVLKLGENKELTKEVAQAWYSAKQKPIVELKTARDAITEQRILTKPGWKHAKESRRGKYEVVETPLMINKRGVFLDEDTKNRISLNEDGGHIRNVARMVVLKDLKTDKVRNFIMIFIGSYDYLKKTKSIDKNSYLHREKDFEGTVLFYEPGGGLVNGWRYVDGKITGRISSGNKKGITPFNQSRNMSEECVDIDIYIDMECQPFMDEDDEFGSVGGIGIICTPGYWDTYQYCTTIPGDGDGGDDGFIDDDGPIDEDHGYMPENADKMAKNGLPTTMAKQLPNTCVTSIMEFINNKVYNGTAKEGSYITHCYQQYGINILKDGLTLDALADLVTSFFTTAYFDSMKSVIDGGGVIMTDIPGLGFDIHNVLIVGYQPNGDYIYMDPEKGYLETAPGSEFGKNYTIYITGNK